MYVDHYFFFRVGGREPVVPVVRLAYGCRISLSGRQRSKPLDVLELQQPLRRGLDVRQAGRFHRMASAALCSERPLHGFPHNQPVALQARRAPPSILPHVSRPRSPPAAPHGAVPSLEPAINRTLHDHRGRVLWAGRCPGGQPPRDRAAHRARADVGPIEPDSDARSAGRHS